MRKPTLAFALLLLLSGCLGGKDASGADDADDGTPDQPGDGWAFSNILIGPGGDAETAVMVGPDGLVLACSHGGFGQPSPSWASEDAGDTWRRLDPQPNPVVSGDCDWAVLEDGTWGLVYDTIASSTVAVSEDRGATWDLNYGSAVPFGGVDRPWLAAEGNTFYLAYANVMASEPAVNSLAVSHDGGHTWTEHHIAHTASLEQSDRPNTVIGHPLVADGTIRIPLASADLSSGGPTWLSFAVSRDEGATWTEEPVAGPYQAYFHLPVASRAPDGTLFITKPEGDSDGSLIDVLISHDDGETWATVHVADDVQFPSVTGPWVDARPDGSATLTWLQQDDDGNRTVWAARIGADGAIVHPPRALSAPVQDGSVFEFIMLDHDEAGRAFIVYPMDTGDCTKTTPAARGRNAQCVWLLREDA
ncbi:MAG TPA: sialidase family protein [Candidatus Thermoplasmatota archaeon]|nr:sialidase family protein [Candidatus Thermoplasmatota archaeon]